MIQAQGPLEIFSEVHNKFCLVIGQGFILEIAKEYPFIFNNNNSIFTAVYLIIAVNQIIAVMLTEVLLLLEIMNVNVIVYHEMA